MAQIKINPKKFWAYVKSQTKTRPTIPDLEMVSTSGTRKTRNDTEKANVLAEYFTSVFTQEPDGEIPRLPNRIIRNPMEKIILTEEEIQKKLKLLNPAKSSGPDGVSTTILKEMADTGRTTKTDLPKVTGH